MNKMTQVSAVLTDEERAIFAAAKTVIDKLLHVSEKPVQPVDTSVRFASIRSFAERRGVSESTVRGWIKQGLPVTSVRPLRINIELAENWLDGTRIPPMRVLKGGRAEEQESHEPRDCV